MRGIRPQRVRDALHTVEAADWLDNPGDLEDAHAETDTTHRQARPWPFTHLNLACNADSSTLHALWYTSRPANDGCASKIRTRTRATARRRGWSWLLPLTPWAVVG